jgi:NADH dehydrogenase
VLIEAGPALLAGLPPAMGRYTVKNLASRGVELHVGDAVTALDERAIYLASGTEIPTATVLWSAGVRPTPVVRDLPLQHARNGGVIVDRDFAVPGRPGVWALGDCAWIPTKTAGDWYPMTAQHAIREGPALAELCERLRHHWLPGVGSVAHVLLVALAGIRPESTRRPGLAAGFDLPA